MAKSAEPLTEAVAPVKMRVGGWAPVVVEARRRGRVAWEKLKAPLLVFERMLVSSPIILARVGRSFGGQWQTYTFPA